MLRNSLILTERQIDTIHAIRAIQSREGIPPSLKDVAEELGVITPTAQQLVNKLIRKGMLTKQAGKSRSMRLTAAASTVPEPKKKRRAA